MLNKMGLSKHNFNVSKTIITVIDILQNVNKSYNVLITIYYSFSACNRQGQTLLWILEYHEEV